MNNFENIVKTGQMFKSVQRYLGGIYFTFFQKVYRKNDLIIHVPMAMTDYSFRGRFFLDSYEEEEARYLSKYLRPTSKVLELGSCLGYVSCLTNKLLEDRTQHVVLEANPKLIPWIEKNKAENECGFHVENKIISKDKENDFYLHELIVGGSSKRRTKEKIGVKGTDFNELVFKYGFSFDTLIMDIEGGELELLRNFQEEIALFKQIFVELHPFAGILSLEEARECENILVDLGFNLVLRDGHFQIWEK